VSAYTPPTKRTKMTRARRVGIFLRDDGMCCLCGVRIAAHREAWIIEHPDAIAMGGSDNDADLHPAHEKCRRIKDKEDAKRLAYRNRVIDSGYANKSRARNPMPGSRASKWKRRMDGTTERRHD